MIHQTLFGTTPAGETVWLWKLANKNGMQTNITNLGASILSLWVPDRAGTLRNVVLGYPRFEQWLTNEAYFGCIVGRTCNRIAGAKFMLNGAEYRVSANRGTYQLHGGFEGFHKKIWMAKPVESAEGNGLMLEYLSPDGEEGFPGNLQVKVIYTLTHENELITEFHAMADKPTPVNLTNHSYFNLAGEGNGSILDHVAQIFSDYYTETNADIIPTGKLLPVEGSALDFTTPRQIGERIAETGLGYDDNFVIRGDIDNPELAGRFHCEESGIGLEVYTTEPGAQFYTSNWFDGSLIGIGGKPYYKHAAFAFETQHFPDSVNHPEFPDTILYPGEIFHSRTKWKFSNPS